MIPNSPNSTPAPAPKNLEAKSAAQIRNFLIVLAAIALSVSVFLGLGTQTPTNTLTEMAKALLEQQGFSVHVPERVPANDAGVCLGQIIEFLHTHNKQ